jgi:hypothetical protein
VLHECRALPENNETAFKAVDRPQPRDRFPHPSIRAFDAVIQRNAASVSRRVAQSPGRGMRSIESSGFSLPAWPRVHGAIAACFLRMLIFP